MFNRLPIDIQERIIKFTGFALVFLGLFNAISFIYYNPDDPSFNVATDIKAHNLLGKAGAYFADPLLQIFGLGAFMFAFLFMAWGYKLLTRQRLYFWWRFIASLLAISVLSALCTVIVIPENLPFKFEQAGGIFGDFLYKTFAAYLNDSGFYVVFIPLTLLFSYFALGLKKDDFVLIGKSIYRIVYYGVIYVWLGFLYLKRAIGSYIREEAHIQEEKPVIVNPLKAKREASESNKKEIKQRKARQASLDLLEPNIFKLPSVELLLSQPTKFNKTKLSESALAQNAKLLERVLDDFGINGKIIGIHPGPVVTLYELEPSPGTKSSRVIGLSDDIARSMSAVSARIAVIPGRNAIGIELPNSTRETVHLRELLEADEYQNSDLKLSLALGKDISGAPIFADLSKMPHLLVAGTTGSGKSVAINTMILSLLYKYPPDECKFIMIDPKMLELSVYDNIPHLLAPVVTEPAKAIVALKWTVKEMENRYRLMSNLGVRNIASYNKQIEEAKADGKELKRTVQTGFDPETGKPIIEQVPLDMSPLPFIVVIVDEMADLMIVAGKDIEASIQRLAQMARAAGIHIIMATQRPSVDVITGVIKANFPTRISFQVTSRIDSRTILGEQGAEQLLGMGDMLYMAGGGRITRVHGPFISDQEVEKVVSYLKTQGTPTYVEDVTKDDDVENSMESLDGESSDLYSQAVTIVRRDGKASTSYIQRVLKIGYNRAADIMDRMEREGVVSPANHVGKREVLAD